MPQSGSRLVSDAQSLLNIQGRGGILLASRKMKKGGTNEGQVTALLLVNKSNSIWDCSWGAGVNLCLPQRWRHEQSR